RRLSSRADAALESATGLWPALRRRTSGCGLRSLSIAPSRRGSGKRFEVECVPAYRHRCDRDVLTRSRARRRSYRRDGCVDRVYVFLLDPRTLYSLDAPRPWNLVTDRRLRHRPPRGDAELALRDPDRRLRRGADSFRRLSARAVFDLWPHGVLRRS